MCEKRMNRVCNSLLNSIQQAYAKCYRRKKYKVPFGAFKSDSSDDVTILTLREKLSHNCFQLQSQPENLVLRKEIATLKEKLLKAHKWLRLNNLKLKWKKIKIVKGEI